MPGGRRLDDVGEHLGATSPPSGPVHEVGAIYADPRRERLVRLHHALVPVEHDDEIDQGVERVFEQAPLAQDLLEQPDVLDADRQLAGQLTREVEDLVLVEIVRREVRRCGTVPLDDQRAQRPPPAAKRGEKGRAVQVRPLEAQPSAARWPVSSADTRSPVGRSSEAAARYSCRCRRSWSQTSTRLAPRRSRISGVSA
jgi:hypothetical protein